MLEDNRGMSEEYDRHPAGVKATYGPEGGIGEGDTAEIAAEISKIADLLTTEATNTPVTSEKIENLENPVDLRENVGSMLDILSSEISGMKSSIDQYLEEHASEISEKTLELVEAIEQGDEQAMQEHGFDLKYAQFNFIVATMIKGHPPLEIETVGPYAFMHFNSEKNKLEVDSKNIPPDEMAGILIASLLRTLDSAAGNTRVVSLLDEFTSIDGNRPLTPEEQEEYVAAMAEFYGQAGVIKPDDVPGEDFVMLRESKLAEKVGELESLLNDSDKGEIVINEETGEVSFMPTPELVAALGLRSKSRRQGMKKKGILIRRAGGAPTCQAMDASGYLGENNDKLMHVVMLDKSMEAQQDRAYALLVALGIARKENYHNIFFDSGQPPEVIRYGVAKLIEKHAEHFKEGLDAYDKREESVLTNA